MLFDSSLCLLKKLNIKHGSLSEIFMAIVIHSSISASGYKFFICVTNVLNECQFILECALFIFFIDVDLLLQKELKRLVAYARSSANLLTRLILQDQTDSYRWEVSVTHIGLLFNSHASHIWFIL